ncbi:hypothetical protein BFW01_g6275 [Lasiodiplodia theobromae]|uniref:Early meiotic induction protein 1 n=1 Tax=Lasiodiplodia theobromae TaxID=45133 RepID=A0A5N5DQD3_9PEZI|nr:uncharacterized protein LTHEOB_7866 [Lasiodiplodia theobromae]KAB2579541.1 Uncharacterized protein DBV05_g1937 [Lasiodiplodia theobromae]KAF4542184.1 hypothetical protein LTHEOB_7866 [Lasiodiplodia theobromae]KAF9635380.1 hypothetical protein BFW01_g6275 [Lasiodiplodia theobromae]
MGWWWRSNTQTPVTKPSDSTPDPVPTSSQPPSSPHDVADKPRAPLSREEQSELELQNLLAELQASVRSGEAPSGGATTTANSSSTAADPTSSSIFPTTMNCRQAFDGAFYCQSLGGQAMNVYRYGSLRSCSENWSDFWFCMRTRSYGDAEKARLISERYEQKEAKYRSGPSSEDIWDVRKPGEELRNPFNKDPDQIEIPGLPKPKRLTQSQE